MLCKITVKIEKKQKNFEHECLNEKKQIKNTQ